MLLRLAAATAVAATLAGCGGDTLTCVEVDLACAPAYEPTFDNVFDQTLLPSCGLTNVCHAGANPKGGLDLSDREIAYQQLVEGGEDLVIPGEPSCSVMIERVFTTSSRLRMPRGSTLPDAHKCALALWVGNGALRGDVPDAGVDAMMPAASPEAP